MHHHINAQGNAKYIDGKICELKKIQNVSKKVQCS